MHNYHGFIIKDDYLNLLKPRHFFVVMDHNHNIVTIRGILKKTYFRFMMFGIILPIWEFIVINMFGMQFGTNSNWCNILFVFSITIFILFWFISPFIKHVDIYRNLEHGRCAACGYSLFGLNCSHHNTVT